jgi:hypothetical protein
MKLLASGVSIISRLLFFVFSSATRKRNQTLGPLGSAKLQHCPCARAYNKALLLIVLQNDFELHVSIQPCFLVILVGEDTQIGSRRFLGLAICFSNYLFWLQTMY